MRGGQIMKNSLFGINGKVTTDLGSSDDNGRAAAIQSDGKKLWLAPVILEQALILRWCATTAMAHWTQPLTLMIW